MKRLGVIILFFTCINLNSYAQLTLADCQRYARNNYPAIKQFDLIEKSRELNLSNASRSWLPRFSITGMAVVTQGIPDISLPGSNAENGNHQFVGIANLSQTIWDGGSSKAERRVAEASADTERGNIEVELYQLYERVNQIYFGILLIDEQILQADILMQTLQSNLKRAEYAAQNGIGYLSDIDKIRVEILNTEQTHINLRSYRKAYCRMLTLITGQEINNQTELVKPDSLLINGITEINRPELRAFESQRNLAEARNSAINSSLMPKIGLRGYAIGTAPGINIGNTKLDHLLVGGISLSWNIGGLYTKNNERAKIRLSRLMIDNREQTFRLNTQMELTRQDGEIERCRQLIRKDSEIVGLREGITRASESKYENGTLTMTDLLNDINAENMARQTKAQHEIEILMYQYQKKTSSGN